MQPDISCDYCFFVIWMTTSGLVFVYPVFFLIYYINLKKQQQWAKKSTLILLNKMEARSASTTVGLNGLITNTASVVSGADSSASATIEASNSSRKPQVFSPYSLLFSESFKIFNTKKKHDSNNNNNNTASGGAKNNVAFTNSMSSRTFNIEHLKLKRYLFLKIFVVTLVWVLTGYSYIRAINLLYCSDVVILFSVNFAFVFIASWIVLHYKFIPIRVIACVVCFCLV